MKTKKQNEKLYIWEASLLVALCVTLCWGLVARARQQDLAGQLIRLHVVAQSDSDRDQAVKLQVRDDILQLLEPALKDAAGPDQAEQALRQLLPAIEEQACETAARAGTACPASATLAFESFPTREYEGFALPAGEYMSLRVVLGDGGGKNWWCVVFPPLCSASAQETDEAFAMLTEDSVSLITGQEEGYEVRFRLLELFEKLRELFG